METKQTLFEFSECEVMRETLQHNPFYYDDNRIKNWKKENRMKLHFENQILHREIFKILGSVYK